MATFLHEQHDTRRMRPALTGVSGSLGPDETCRTIGIVRQDWIRKQLAGHPGYHKDVFQKSVEIVPVMEKRGMT